MRNENVHCRPAGARWIARRGMGTVLLVLAGAVLIAAAGSGRLPVLQARHDHRAGPEAVHVTVCELADAEGVEIGAKMFHGLFDRRVPCVGHELVALVLRIVHCFLLPSLVTR